MAGGNSLAQAFEWMVIAMFNYMTDLSFVQSSSVQSVDITGKHPVSVRTPPTRSLTQAAAGHDLHSLLFNWMDECLFLFVGGDLFVAKVGASI